MSIKSRANKIVSAGSNSANETKAKDLVENIVLVEQSPEKLVALGAWSDHELMVRVGKCLEKIGVELLRNDEWTECDRCFGIIPIASRIVKNGETLCAECDPENDSEDEISFANSVNSVNSKVMEGEEDGEK